MILTLKTETNENLEEVNIKAQKIADLLGITIDVGIFGIKLITPTIKLINKNCDCGGIGGHSLWCASLS